MKSPEYQPEVAPVGTYTVAPTMKGQVPIVALGMAKVSVPTLPGRLVVKLSTVKVGELMPFSQMIMDDVGSCTLKVNPFSPFARNVAGPGPYVCCPSTLP